MTPFAFAKSMIVGPLSLVGLGLVVGLVVGFAFAFALSMIVGPLLLVGLAKESRSKLDRSCEETDNQTCWEQFDTWTR